jgi:hypothetical protein
VTFATVPARSRLVVTGTGDPLNAVVRALATDGVEALDAQLESATLEDAYLRLISGPSSGRRKWVAMSVTTASAATAAASHRPQRRAPRKLIVTEFKAAWRDPAWLVLGLGVPVMLLVIFGLAPAFHKQIHGPAEDLNGPFVGGKADVRPWAPRSLMAYT